LCSGTKWMNMSELYDFKGRGKINLEITVS
jgi:hypothetical protein